MFLEKKNDSAEKRVILAIAAALVSVTAVSTVLHHLFPWVLKVQPFEGVPYTGYTAMFLLDLIPIAAAAACLYHAAGTMGAYRAALFLGGAFFFSGLIENAMILLGRNHLLGLISPQFKDVTGTYYFTRGFFWWGEMPAAICLGWFFITYACRYIAGVLAPKSGVWARAAMAGLLAMILDLWLDPVQVHPALRSWVWTSNESLKLFSVPFTNFLGWFLFAFLFVMAFEKVPRIKEKWGSGRGALLFFLLLLAFKLLFVGTLMAVGAAEMRYISPPVNLTLWGI